MRERPRSGPLAGRFEAAKPAQGAVVVLPVDVPDEAQLPAPFDFPVVVPVEAVEAVLAVEVVPVEPGSASRARSPCRLCAGQAFALIRILTHLPLPVLWQIQSFLAECLSVVVDPVDAVEDVAVLFLPLPGGGPLATATEAATPARNRAVITSAFSFTGTGLLGGLGGVRPSRCFGSREPALYPRRSLNRGRAPVGALPEPAVNRVRGYLTSTVAPASSSWALIESASSRGTPSLTGFGALSTTSLAS